MIERLKAIKANLEHARRFKLHPNDWRSAMTQAEGDIEELLIDYGFQKSEDRDPDTRNIRVEVREQRSIFGPENERIRVTTIFERIPHAAAG